jgi:hypothetical protein
MIPHIAVTYRRSLCLAPLDDQRGAYAIPLSIRSSDAADGVT